MDDLALLRGRLAELVRASEVMPASKVGTAWERDRIFQRDAIRRQIARLEAEL